LAGLIVKKEDLVSPFLEFGIVRKAALENDRIVVVRPGDLPLVLGSPPSAVDNHFRGSAETADA